MASRVYNPLRTMVERLGGTMEYRRQGYRYGAWVITVGGKQGVIEAPGNRSFPELDRLHVPNRPNARYWEDYYNELVPDAESRLLSLLQ